MQHLLDKTKRLVLPFLGADLVQAGLRLRPEALLAIEFGQRYRLVIRKLRPLLLQQRAQLLHVLQLLFGWFKWWNREWGITWPLVLGRWFALELVPPSALVWMCSFPGLAGGLFFGRAMRAIALPVGVVVVPPQLSACSYLNSRRRARCQALR